MTGRKLNLDLGLMTMQIGEDRRSSDVNFNPENADPFSVARFKSLMQGSCPASADTDTYQELPVQFSLTRCPQPCELYDADEIGADIEYLWVSIGDGAHDVREVIIGLRRDVLPETSVHFFEAGGRLHIELSSTCSVTCEWTANKLYELALDLGERLNRPLRLAVLSPQSGERMLETFDWPEDFQ